VSASLGLDRLFSRKRKVWLDQVAAHIAQLDRGAPKPADIVKHLDELAAEIGPLDGPDDVMTAVFGTLGFRGNTEHYHSANNSYLHRVLDTRLGIPITLSIVAIEIGRRCGVVLEPIGMPGHFLIGTDNKDWDTKEAFFDPMAGGRRLDRADVARMFTALMPDLAFDSEYLDAVDAKSVAMRMLNNLRGVELRRGDLGRLCDVVSAQLELPNATNGMRLEYAQLMSSRGDFAAAVGQLERLAELDPERAAELTAAASRLRANFN
jgi:regulator of sirC expression with transglutaminase-like and TPR domain